jgi:hypothetical protein
MYLKASRASGERADCDSGVRITQEEAGYVTVSDSNRNVRGD